MEPIDDPRPDVPGYTLGARLGAGGSAVVWAATRDADGAPVAVKLVAVGAQDQADAAVRELWVLARVEVEGLVRFHEAVTLPGEERRVALVLDLVGGGSLHRVVRARGHLSVGESVTILAPVARALAGLHAVGVVHGDVTPGNVLVERSGRPLLADLGVARLVGEVPGDAVGTEGFVAPEVLDGGSVTAAADVYAAGALAWWCVTGEVPGPASWRQPLQTLAPGLPPAWSEATLRALSSDPSARPTAAEVALAWFDSAQCEPLRLVVGNDETSLLTHRLRRSSPELVEAAPATRRERLVRAVWSTRGPALGSSRGPAWRRGPRAAAALTGMGLTAVLLAGALMAGGLLPAPDWLASAADTEATAPVVRSSSVSDAATPPAAFPRTASGDDGPARSVQRLVAAPTKHTTALVQVLATLRARAMVSGRESDLGALDAPGSPALARDTADLRRLRQSRIAYEGVQLTVRSAHPVTVAERVATVEAVVDTSAYREVFVTDGRRVTRSEDAVPGQALLIVLVWSGDRWLIEDVGPAG